MPKNKAFGFVTDPLNTFNRDAETTLFLMREVAARGASIFICEPRDLFLKQNEVWALAQEINILPRKYPFHRILREAPLSLAALDCLFLRKDPPFDLAYLHHLYLLRNLEKKVLMINAPSAILRHNEKLSTLNFEFAAKTMVASRWELFEEWAGKFEEGVVIKPLNSFGGRGIFRWKKKSAKVGPPSGGKTIFKKMTHNETQPVIVQEFLPEVRHGDKRVILWNGKMLGAFVRKPTRRGEFRANLHLGGRYESTTLSANDWRIVRKVGPWCKKEGLYFVGLDVIGSHLSEINVTSPMGLNEIDTVTGKKSSVKILDDILKWI